MPSATQMERAALPGSTFWNRIWPRPVREVYGAWNRIPGPKSGGQRFSAFFAFHLVPKMGVSILAEEFVLLFQHFSGRRVCPGSTFWNRIWPTRGAAWGTIFCAISGPFEIRCRALPAAQRRTPRPPQPPQTPNFRGAASA